MGNRNYNGTQISQSVTITEKAGADTADVRNRIFIYNADGAVVLAEDGTKPPVGVALIESGLNDISGRNSGSVTAGDDVDIQIKDIGYVIAGEALTKGSEVTAGAGGCAVTAKAGDYVAGIALGAAKKGGYCRVQILKYQKGAGGTDAGTGKNEGGTE